MERILLLPCFLLCFLVVLWFVLPRRHRLLPHIAPVPVLLNKKPFSDETTVVIFPHCGREAFALVLVEELSNYLRHSSDPFLLLGVQQLDPPTTSQKYCKGLSWNVAFHWLQTQGAWENLGLALQDVDALPRHNVSYKCPPAGNADVWWQTTGGIKVRFGDVLRVNGYPISAKGWGREDQDFWLRLRRAGVQLQEWPETLTPEDPAVVLNLEWMTVGEEPFLRDHYWGRWTDRVHTVSQQNPRWGLRETVPVPPKSWFSPQTFDRNRRLSDIINKMSDENYWNHVGQDGLTGLHFKTEPQLDSFFQHIPCESHITVLNLTFKLEDVVLEDGLQKQRELLWYQGEAVSCSTNQDCPGDLSCEASQCLWPFS